jgi:hypothetical protein
VNEQLVPFVLDLHIDHERFGSRSDPSLNGHLYYQYNLDGPLNDVDTDKILQYRSDYNNRPSTTIFFMTIIPSTSGCLHIDFRVFYFYRIIGKLTSFLHIQKFMIRENPNFTILPLDSRNQESAQIPGFWNPMVKWCNWDFL